MKPLFLTFLTFKEPFLTLAYKLKEDIERLDAGDFQVVQVTYPGGDANFYVVSCCLLYSYITREINTRPIVMLDCDNELKKPINHLFEADFDIATVFRFAQMRTSGRQDYCGGLIALNNKRPDIIRKFWIEWINKTALWEEKDLERFPDSLRFDGWNRSWLGVQSCLNQILLPECNQGDPEKDEHKISPGDIYETNGYKVMPLDRRVYGALPRDSEDACVIHYKGKTKNQRLVKKEILE